MVHCTGCHRSFTVSGYTFHVQRTGSSACVAAYHAQLDNTDNIDEECNENGDDNANDNLEVFTGDFFGNYQDDDFDWPEDEQDQAGGMRANTSCIKRAEG
jgi:hypothetical protein